jgi:hypothetical protein
VDKLSIVLQTMKNLGQKNDPYDVIWVEMDYIDIPGCNTFQLVRIRHGKILNFIEYVTMLIQICFCRNA